MRFKTCKIRPYFCSIVFLLILLYSIFVSTVAQEEPAGATVTAAVRIVRFRVAYAHANAAAEARTPNWQALLHKSMLASLRFVNKHWLICGNEPHNESLPADKSSSSSSDCGKLQVTGEEIPTGGYRINATFIANRDPIRNAKVDATSTIINVVQIGLRGGIFQYTNGLKILGKPSPQLEFEEAFFCFPGYQIVTEESGGNVRCERDARPRAAVVAGAPIATRGPKIVPHEHRRHTQHRKHRRQALRDRLAATHRKATGAPETR